MTAPGESPNKPLIAVTDCSSNFYSGRTKEQVQLQKQVTVDVFGRTDFSWIFIFEPPDFVADSVAGFFSSFLCEKVPRKILQENHRQNPPNFV